MDLLKRSPPGNENGGRLGGESGRYKHRAGVVYAGESEGGWFFFLFFSFVFFLLFNSFQSSPLNWGCEPQLSCSCQAKGSKRDSVSRVGWLLVGWLHSTRYGSSLTSPDRQTETETETSWVSSDYSRRSALRSLFCGIPIAFRRGWRRPNCAALFLWGWLAVRAGLCLRVLPLFPLQ